MPQEEITDIRPPNYSRWHRGYRCPKCLYVAQFRNTTSSRVLCPNCKEEHMHRNLPGWCFQTDGDWFEQRRVNGELHTVAYIETIQMPSDKKTFEDYPVWSSKKSLGLEIEAKMKIPAYIVWHSPDCLLFFIQRITKDKPIKMTEKEYIAFIRGLKHTTKSEMRA